MFSYIKFPIGYKLYAFLSCTVKNFKHVCRFRAVILAAYMFRKVKGNQLMHCISLNGSRFNLRFCIVMYFVLKVLYLEFFIAKFSKKNLR